MMDFLHTLEFELNGGCNLLLYLQVRGGYYFRLDVGMREDIGRSLVALGLDFAIYKHVGTLLLTFQQAFNFCRLLSLLFKSLTQISLTQNGCATEGRRDQ